MIIKRQLNQNLSKFKFQHKPSLTSSFNVILNGGSKFESNQGISNGLKNFTFKNTLTRSSLRQARETESLGGILYSTLTRDNLILSAEFLPGNEQHFVSILADVVNSTKFTSHEFNESVLPSIKSETNSALSDPIISAIEVAHSIAFRRGLGNSLYANDHNLPSLDQIKEFASKVYTSDNVGFLSTGPNSSTFSSLIPQHFSELKQSQDGELKPEQSVYHGGEQRLTPGHHSTPTAFISWGSASTSPSLDILSTLLGGQSNIKWNKGLSPLAKIDNASVNAINFGYNDASLFGFIVQASTDQNVKQASQQAVSTLQSIANDGVDADSLKSAIAKAKFNFTLQADTNEGWKHIVSKGLLKDQVKSLDETLQSYDSVTVDSIKNAASDLFRNKVTLVTVGGRDQPYADELGL